MNKALKLIVLFLSLALVAGLFVFLLNYNGKASNFNDIGTLEDEDLGEISSAGGIESEPVKSNTDVFSQIPKGSKEDPKKIEEKVGAGEVPEVPASGWTQEVLAEEISKTVGFSAENDEVIVSYAQPNIPNNYHFTFKVEIFDENGKTVDRYVSDAGWFSDNSNYDPKEKIEEIKMKVKDMKNKMAFVVIKVGDKYMANSANVYQLTINYDGSMVWNNAVIK